MNTPQEFASLLAALRALPERGAALATLIRTSGSTFRRAGARMLIDADGRLLRGLSGGCPERDIAAHAREVIAQGKSRVLRYNRQQNFDLMLEMGCGGELEVLVEPLRSSGDRRFAEAVNRCLEARSGGVLATVFAQEGACLPQPQRLLRAETADFDEIADRRLAGAVGARIAQLPHRFKPQLESLAGYEVLFEQLQPPLAAYLVGCNASSQALARLLAQLGWEVTLIDHRDDASRPSDLPPQIEQIAAGPAQMKRQGEVFDARSFAVVMTHNLERDIEYLQQLAPLPLRYLGAIGSRQRVERLRTSLPGIGAQLHAPAGLDIGSETPEEIALAIAAEMLAVANGHDGGFLSRARTPIHR